MQKFLWFFFYISLGMWSSGLDSTFQLHPCQMQRQETFQRSCSVTSRGLHSRTALTSTSYYNFITTDYQSVSPNLFQNYCSTRQSNLLGKHDLWFFIPRYVVLYFTKLEYLLFAWSSIFNQFPQGFQEQLFSSGYLLKRQRSSVNFVLSFISVWIQVKIKQASLHKSVFL